MSTTYTVKIFTVKDDIGTTASWLTVPTELAKLTVKHHKDEMTPGGIWTRVLASPTRSASRKKDEFVELYTEGFTTGTLCNMLARSGNVTFDCYPKDEDEDKSQPEPQPEPQPETVEQASCLLPQQKPEATIAINKMAQEANAAMKKSQELRAEAQKLLAESDRLAATAARLQKDIEKLEVSEVPEVPEILEVPEDKKIAVKKTVNQISERITFLYNQQFETNLKVDKLIKNGDNETATKLRNKSNAITKTIEELDNEAWSLLATIGQYKPEPEPQKPQKTEEHLMLEKAIATRNYREIQKALKAFKMSLTCKLNASLESLLDEAQCLLAKFA